MELPADDGRLEGGAGIGQRQQPDHQTRRVDLAEHASDGGAGGGGRNPGRCAQCRPGAWRGGRPGPRSPHGRRRAVVHRLDRGRPDVPALLLGEQPQGDRPRVRRQEPAGHHGQPAGSRLRRGPGPPRRLHEHGRELHLRLAPHRPSIRPRRAHRQARQQDRRLAGRRPARPLDTDRADDRAAAPRQGGSSSVAAGRSSPRAAISSSRRSSTTSATR